MKLAKKISQLLNLEDERAPRLEAASSIKNDFRSQIDRIKETIHSFKRRHYIWRKNKKHLKCHYQKYQKTAS